jgi:hypothetical protein
MTKADREDVSDDALLPFVDAWTIDIEAPPRVVWDTLLASVPGARSGLGLRAWAALWGADPAESNGLASHVLGAERPGFVVAEVVPTTTYALAGRHRFARYQVAFGITQRGAGYSRLTAETFASFPGMGGRLYRALVISAKSHALVMWVIMRVLRRRAERSARRQE